MCWCDNLFTIQVSNCRIISKKKMHHIWLQRYTQFIYSLKLSFRYSFICGRIWLCKSCGILAMQMPLIRFVYAYILHIYLLPFSLWLHIHFLMLLSLLLRLKYVYPSCVNNTPPRGPDVTFASTLNSLQCTKKEKKRR